METKIRAINYGEDDWGRETVITREENARTLKK